MTTKNETPVLSEKDQEMIAVGASVAAGCLPCTKFHLRIASDAGAKDGEILQAVRDAALVRRVATEIMARAGGLSPVGSDRPAPEDQGPRTPIRELVSIAAAYAVNCSTSLGTHMTAARALGATDQQILTAVKIACAIRDVAVQKARAAAGAFFGVSEEEAGACDCAGDEAGAEETSRAGASVEECHCRTEDHQRSDE
jgi:AhpD family alkylhydroperoxidase